MSTVKAPLVCPHCGHLQEIMLLPIKYDSASTTSRTCSNAKCRKKFKYRKTYGRFETYLS